MQLKYTDSRFSCSSKLLQKCTSLPALSDTTNSSSNSIDSTDDSYRKSIIKWILNFTKRVGRDTQYLAISTFNKLVAKGIYLTEDNFQQIAASLVLIAAKMNQIYPPKITSLLQKCKDLTKEDIIAMESKIMSVFGFDIATESTAYSWLFKVLGDSNSNRLEQCEKLLRIVSPHKDIYFYSDEILAYAIVYLIIPNYIREKRLQEGTQIKQLAMKIYNLYSEEKGKYEKQKLIQHRKV